MTHVRTSPYYPQSNGKIQRWHKSLKGECIRPGTPLTPEDARRLIQEYVDHFNGVRLHRAPSATSRQRTCWQGGKRRSYRRAIASWKPRVSSGKYAGRKRREESKRQ